MNKRILKAKRLEPPYEKKGKGTPIVGNSLMSIVIFTKKCANRKVATQ